MDSQVECPKQGHEVRLHSLAHPNFPARFIHMEFIPSAYELGFS